MYIDATYDYYNEKITGWLRDTDGSLVKFTEAAPYYCYVDDPNGDIKSMFGSMTVRKDFGSRQEFENFLTLNRNRTWESDISPLYKFLSDTFYGAESTKLNIGYFDIEVDFDLSNGKGYPLPLNPFGQINSISMFDTAKMKYVMIILSDVDIKLKDDEFDVEVYRCVTERQLLDTFIKMIDNVDVLTAWNGDLFDIPYIIQRCKRVYGDQEGLKKLCRDGFSAKEREIVDNFGNDAIVYDLVGRVHLDLMDLYQNFTFGEQGTKKLDNICEIEEVGRKVSYKGDLGELYRTNPQKFFEYSLHDSRLLYKLDMKKKFIDLAINMGRRASVRYKDVMGSIKYLEHSIRNYTHFIRDEMLVLPDKEDNSREPFPGAFVLDNKVGIYSWTCSIDLASLYPSTIRAINISPETHLLQCENNDEDFVKVVHQSNDDINVRHMETGEYFTLKGFELHQLIKDNNYTISAYGSIFDSKQGIIPEILALWYTERKNTKAKSKEYFKMGDKAKGEFYDMQQNLAKLGLNSLYGAISNPYSRLYTIFCAASTTLTGQMIERHQIYMADKLVKENVK